MDPTATILVVEDEPAIADAVAARLRAEGFGVHVAHDGPSGVAAAAEHLPDLVVLDVMLPGFDGLEVCRRVQAQRPVPVLMLTAREDEADTLMGLAAGADDYLTKPFSMRELVARVHALLRRVRRAAELAGDGEAAPVQRIGDLEIDRSGRRVRRAGTDVHLTPLGVRPARLPGRSDPAQVLTREQLLAQVWDWADASGTRTVDSHVKAVRRKLGGDVIRTVHGIGYAVGAEDGARPRPLDPLRSIKAKLGVLVAVTVAVSSLFVWYGLVHLDWRPRYTLPVAVLLALGVTQVLARGMTSPLRSMTAAARAMARGDYSRRVPTPRATRSASWPAPSTGWPPTSRPPTATGASSSPT